MSSCKQKFWILALFTSVLCTPLPSPGAQLNDAKPEYAVKAAYILNILRFVEWADGSESEQDNDIIVCLLGKNKFEHFLQPIVTEKIGKKKIRLLDIQKIHQVVNCSLVYVSNTKEYPPIVINNFVSDKQIVTLGNDISFSRNGGMFSFYITDNKVRLGYNESTLYKSKVRVRALLLEVSKKIEGDQ